MKGTLVGAVRRRTTAVNAPRPAGRRRAAPSQNLSDGRAVRL